MRWAKSAALPIALILIVIGGYSLTVNHQIEADRDIKPDELHARLPNLDTQELSADVDSKSFSADKYHAAPGSLPLATQSELALLRKELIEIRKQQSRFQQLLDSVMFASHSDNDEYEPSESLDIENETIVNSTAIEVEGYFESEPIDPAWSASAEAEIQSTVEGRSMPGIYVTNTECRNTVCRIEVELDDAKTAMEGLPFLPMLIPWAGESYTRTESTQDGTAVVLYAVREGYTFPDDGVAVLEN